MDIETVRNWVAVIALVISASSVIVVWVKSPGQKIATSLDKVNDSLKAHDRRIQAVEAEVKHLPTSEEFALLQVQVTSVQGDVKRVEDIASSVRRTVERMDGFLRGAK